MNASPATQNTTLELFHDGSPYHMETSPLICSGFALNGLAST